MQDASPVNDRQAKPLLRKFFFSFSSRIVLLVAATALITSIALEVFYYKQVSKEALHLQKEQLSAEANLISPLFWAAFSELKADVTFLSHTPPIQGLIRSSRNADIDPQDGSTRTLWSSRLETIFSSLLRAKSSYVSIRYIGIKNNGMELVHVRRENDKILVVSPEDLEQKSDAFFYKDVLDTAPNDVYYSMVAPDRAQSTTQTPFLPVIRVAVPIFDNNGNVFGMIIINAAYESILKDFLNNLEVDKDIYIIGQTGDFFYYNNHKYSHDHHRPHNADDNPHFNYINSDLIHDHYPFIQDILNAQEHSKSLTIDIHGENHLAYYRKSSFSQDPDEGFSITALITVPEERLFQPINTMQRTSLFVSGGIMFVICLIASTFAFYQMRPLKKMTREIQLSQDGGQTFSLPTHIQNEVGDLARAFDGLIQKLELSRQTETQALARLQAVLNSTVDGLITINEHGHIESYNNACIRMFGYTEQEVMGKNIKILMPEPYRGDHDTYIKNYHDTGEKKIIGIGREVEGLRKDGSVFPIDLSVSEVDVQGLRIYSGIIRDITLRKKAEEEVLRSNEELERFAYIASHDLQEPIRMISNFTDLLAEEYGDGMDETAQNYMNFITNSSKRMQEMIADLLEYSRVGKEEIGFEDFVTQERVNHVLEYLQDNIDKTNAKITVGTLPETLYANPVRFCRVMQNLIGNAIKYRADDRAPVIHIAAEDKGREWLFSVTDNGLGIKKDYLSEVFVIFKRQFHGKKYEGTGIGLAVCKKIIESFGGKIYIESEYGTGSTFYFTIPKH